MCVMGGIGTDDDRAIKALDSAQKMLDTPPYGMVLNNPAYTEYKLNLGEISSYPPGYKENAGIFCHNNPWVACAEATVGRGDRAWEIFSKICPAYLEDISEVHRTEPYIYAQMIAGKDAVRQGEAKNSWLTGTASWNFITVTQWILGVKPHYDGLMIDPCIPTSWEGYKVTRKFRGVTYNIKISNPDKVSKGGVKSLTLNGQKVDGQIVLYTGNDESCNVEVVLG